MTPPDNNDIQNNQNNQNNQNISNNNINVTQKKSKVTQKKQKKSKKKSSATKKKNENKEKILEYIEAIKDSFGIVSEIAEKLCVSRKTVYEYIKKYPEIAEAYEDEKEKILDACESSLFALISSQNLPAITYYLNIKGKSRGYGARDQFGVENNTITDNKKTGILLAPGLVTDKEWEDAAKKK